MLYPLFKIERKQKFRKVTGNLVFDTYLTINFWMFNGIYLFSATICHLYQISDAIGTILFVYTFSGKKHSEPSSYTA